jgi:hypothetical protein
MKVTVLNLFHKHLGTSVFECVFVTFVLDFVMPVVPRTSVKVMDHWWSASHILGTPDVGYRPVFLKLSAVAGHFIGGLRTRYLRKFPDTQKCMQVNRRNTVTITFFFCALI